MTFLTPNIRISMSLVCIALSVFFLALGCQLVPDYHASRLEARRSYCEHLALHCSLAIQREDVQTVKELVQASLRRNPEVLSAGLREGSLDSSASELLLEMGDHRRDWQASLAQQGSSDFIGVPILHGNHRWGTLELHFQPLYDSSGWRFLTHPILLFSLFFAAVCGVAYYLFIRYLFRQIDFAQARIVPQRVRATLNTLAEGVVILDKEGQIVMANDAFAQATGQAAADLQGRKASELDWTIEDEDGDTGLPWERVLNQQETQTSSILRLLRDQETSILSVSSTPILGEDGVIRGALASFNNLTPIERKNNHLQTLLRKLRKSRAEIQRQNLHLHHLATRDPLTSCLNRRAFFAEFEHHWVAAERNNRALSCIMFDIDHFKAINDNHGHSTGDQVLQAVSAVLIDKIRASDLICRYGGEEFCILLPGQSLDDAGKTAERLRVVVESARPANLLVTASLGVSAIQLGAKNMRELLDQADKALYYAKRTGRNRTVGWDEVPIDQSFSKDKERTGARPPSDNAVMPFQTVNVLLTTLGARHPGTADHCRRVADLCVTAANGILSSSECYVLELAALLHDIGKLGVPDSILLKSTPLTPDEWSIIKSHEVIGEELVAAAFSSPQLVEIVRGYHYRFGGDLAKPGCPKGDAISAAARLLAIADAYDSMVTDQVYRKRRSQEQAFHELRSHAGTQFDPDLVDLFIQRVTDRQPARAKS